VSGFFSREAGQARRAWLDGQSGRALDAIQYYAGPGINVNALAELIGVLNPVNDAMQYGAAMERVMDPNLSGGQRAQAGVDAGLNALTFLAPAAGGAIAGRMAAGRGGSLVDDAARSGNALAETFTSMGQSGERAARRFAADERGAVGAEGAADEIARMLREGRASEITDDMMARLTPEDNARLLRLYDEGATGARMPMDETSRMQRAREMGFDTTRPVYHGTPDQRELMARGFDATPQGQRMRDVGEWVDVPRPAFTTNQRAVARTYADPNRAWDYQNAEPGVLELYRRPGNDAVIDAQGARFRGLHGGDVSDATGVDLSRYRGQVQDGEVSTDGLSMMLNDQGFSGARIRNVVDDYMGHGRAAEVQMTMRPSDLRLRTARFDPRLRHLAHLSAGVGGAAVLGTQEQGDGLSDVREYLRSIGALP
jgi:hypothetical protein